MLLIVACGSNGTPDLTPDANRKTLKNVPDWYMETPQKEGFRYESSSATSQDMQMAISKARLDAANTLAGQVKSEMNGLVKRAEEETGLGADSEFISQFSQTQEQVISSSLENYRTAKKEIQEERTDTGYIYRAYVLIEWDEGASDRRLLNSIKSDQLIYDQMRSTELFNEMEEKVEAYRNRQ